jgi:hypothetical protein|tara:strand:- start:229 stop:465 length:237 start_codon:yes stop_codon:yes gene_type:complete
MAKNKINEATDVASSRSRCGKVDKDKTKQLTADGTAWEENFINFLTNKIDKIEGSENVSISINGDKPKPIKEIKKKIN